ncbi:uncharacterized threonine-rich GPI-anchored glycoprotein PJ4664.02 [Hyalella azteca]|uniref:Uncharacterized threonine-rich GPI-anchored glycoprotein PJ4664.02 n=1 Tax=Hyalella azteca TaxID=294128 RepID=A0A8B7PI47_HYAAZ|nr:uncharacterized threonine-rich GPI-anchored glycoprotein PJ4664.02 [Hyalella azteca]
MAGIEVDLNYQLRRELLQEAGVASDKSVCLAPSDRSFISDGDWPCLDKVSVSEGKIDSFAAIFRANRDPAVESYIVSVIQSDHDYSHHWSSDPQQKSSATNNTPIVKLFAPQGSSESKFSHVSSRDTSEDQVLDIEGDWDDGAPDPPYNEELACKLMYECERHMDFAGNDTAAAAEKQASEREGPCGAVSGADEEEEAAAHKPDINLCKDKWTAQQERVFDRAVAILDGERLARLACSGVKHEPARRRALLDRSASKFRRLLSGECRWEMSLCQWLHSSLLHSLTSPYLIAYLDILQSLHYAVPTLMDKLIAPSSKLPSSSTKGTTASTLNSSSSSALGAGFPHTTAPAGAPSNDDNGGVMSSSIAAVGLSGHDASNGPGVEGTSSAAAGAGVYDAKNNSFGGSISSLGLNLLLKRPWDPAMPILHSNKPRPLGSDSPVVLLVPHCPQLCAADVRRHKNFASTLRRVTTTLTITVHAAPDGSVSEWLERTVVAVLTKLREWRASLRPIVLAGWGAGALLAAQIAALDSSISGVVCLSPPFSGPADYRGDLSNSKKSSDPAADVSNSDDKAAVFLSVGEKRVTTAGILSAVRCPILLVVGDRAQNSNMQALEELRERVSDARLVVLCGADNKLRLQHNHRRVAALTHSLVDRCIVDEMATFLKSLMPVVEDVPAGIREAAAAAASVAHNTSLAKEAKLSDAFNTEPLSNKRKMPDDISTHASLPSSPKKYQTGAPTDPQTMEGAGASPDVAAVKTQQAVSAADGLLGLSVPAVSMALVSNASSAFHCSSSVTASPHQPSSPAVFPQREESVWSGSGAAGAAGVRGSAGRRGRRAGRGRGRGSRAPLPGQLIALGGGVGVAAQAHLKSAGRRLSALSGRGIARGTLPGRPPYVSTSSSSVPDSEVMLLSPQSSNKLNARTGLVKEQSAKSIKEQVALAAKSEAQLLAAVASITPQSPPEVHVPSKITTVSTCNVVRSLTPQALTSQAFEIVDTSQQPHQVHYVLHPQGSLSSVTSAFVVGSIGSISSTAKIGGSDLTLASVMGLSSGSLADKRKSIPSIMSSVGDRRKNSGASSALCTPINKKPIIFQTSVGGVLSNNRIILPNTLSSASSNMPSLIVSSSPSVVSSLAPIKKLIRPTLAYSSPRLTAPVILTNQKSLPSLFANQKPNATFVSSPKSSSSTFITGTKVLPSPTSVQKALIAAQKPVTSFVATQKGGSTSIANQTGAMESQSHLVPQIIGTLRGGRVSISSADSVVSGMLQSVPSILSGARFVTTRGGVRGSMTRGGIVQARTLAAGVGRGSGPTQRNLITVGAGTNSTADAISASIIASSTGAAKSNSNIAFTTVPVSGSKAATSVALSLPLTMDASTCTSPSPSTVVCIDTSKNINKSQTQTPVGVKQLLLGLPKVSEQTIKILPQKSQQVLKVADNPQSSHTKIMVSSQKPSQFYYKPLVVKKQNIVAKVASPETIGTFQILKPSVQSEMTVQGSLSGMMTVSSPTPSLILGSAAHSSAAGASLTLAVTVAASESTLTPAPSVSVLANISPQTQTSSLEPVPSSIVIPPVMLNPQDSILPLDSSSSSTEKLDLLASAASEISQKLTQNQDAEFSLETNNLASAEHNYEAGADTNKDGDENQINENLDAGQFIEVSLEEVPKIDTNKLHCRKEVRSISKEKEQTSPASSTLQSPVMGSDAQSSGIFPTNKVTIASTSGEASVTGGAIAAVNETNDASSSSYLLQSSPAMGNLDSPMQVNLPAVVESSSTDHISSTAGSTIAQQKLILVNCKPNFKKGSHESDSSSDVEIVGESSSGLSVQTSTFPLKDKSKITLSKSSCSQIKILSSSTSSSKFSICPPGTQSQIIVSTQPGKGTTILRPGRSSLGTIDGKNITKLTVRPTTASLKLTSGQHSILNTNKITIASSSASPITPVPPAQGTSSSSAPAQVDSKPPTQISSSINAKDPVMMLVSASMVTLTSPSLMTVGASEAAQPAHNSVSSQSRQKTNRDTFAEFVATSNKSEEVEKRTRNIAELDTTLDSVKDSSNVNETRGSHRIRSPTVRVVSANEAFRPKQCTISNKVHIAKPDKLTLRAMSSDSMLGKIDSSTPTNKQVSFSPASQAESDAKVPVKILINDPSALPTRGQIMVAASREKRKSSVSSAGASSVEESPGKLHASLLSPGSITKKIKQNAGQIPTKVSLHDVVASTNTLKSDEASELELKRPPASLPIVTSSSTTITCDLLIDASTAVHNLKSARVSGTGEDDNVFHSTERANAKSTDAPILVESPSGSDETSCQKVAAQVQDGSDVLNKSSSDPVECTDSLASDDAKSPTHKKFVLPEQNKDDPLCEGPQDRSGIKLAVFGTKDESASASASSKTSAGRKVTRGAKQNSSGKIQKRSSARLSIIPFEKTAAHLRSGKKRSS